MALFHFRIKSDKKPDGSKISAVNHVDYIRREGVFSDVDRTSSFDYFSGNFISSSEIKDACGGLDSLLYRTDDFGCIKNSPDGIEVSENSSQRFGNTCQPCGFNFLLISTRKPKYL